MSKILETLLPIARGDKVSVETYNRFNATEISETQFATGAIIFNTTNSIHQAFDGTQLRDLYSHQTYPTGQGITASLGSVTVTIS